MTAANLDDIRGRLRQDLDDVDQAARTWSDAELDRHIAHALRELSAYLSLQQKTTLATTNGSRDLSIASLAGLIRVVAVEYKTSDFPPTYVDFSLWKQTVTLLEDPIPDGSNAAIYWEGLHQLGGATSTLSEALEDILVTGAAAHACRAQAAFAANRINTGGPDVDRDYRTMANAYEADFRRELIRRSARIRQARLFVPSVPPATMETDPGPP